MLSATYLGPALSPSELYYSRYQARHATSTAANPSFPGPSSSPTPLRRHLNSVPRYLTRRPATEESGVEAGGHIEEELAWFDRTVLWTRESRIYRKYTFEHEQQDVQYAIFAPFRSPSSYSSSSGSWSSSSRASDHSATFGPFNTSHTARWVGIRNASSTSPTKPTAERVEHTLVVFLQTKAIVYHPTGQTDTVHLPFTVEKVWALDEGLMVQRAAEARELRTLKVFHDRPPPPMRGAKPRLSALDASMSMLHALADEEDEPTPRLFTLDHPSAEFKAVSETRHAVTVDSAVGVEVSILLVAESYPLVVALDYKRQEIVFYRRTRQARTNTAAVPVSPVLPARRDMGPEEMLRQPEPPRAPIPRSRPSLNRTASYGTDRRVSSGGDPLDRDVRRAPRLSRGETSAAPDLQAALDAQPFSTSTIKRGRISGVSALGSKSENRRTSGVSGRPEAAGDIAHEPLESMSAPREENTDLDIRSSALRQLGRRDLGETTMMVDVRREDGMRSEFTLERIWVWKPPSHLVDVDIHVFTSENLSGDSVIINIHVPQPEHRLYMFQALRHPQDVWTIAAYFNVPCTSAIPILATRPSVYDVLVATTEGLALLTSSGRQLPLRLPVQSGDGHDEVVRRLASSLSMTRDESMSVSSYAIKFFDAARERFSVILEDGTRSRYSAKLVPEVGLVRTCIEAISYALPAQRFFDFKCEVMSQLQLLDHRNYDPDTDWEAFAAVCRTVIGAENAQTIEGVSKVASAIGNARRSSDPVTKRLASYLKHAKHGPARPAPPSMPGVTLDMEDRGPFLTALHLVGQDCRLSIDRQHELLQLVPLIGDVASRTGQRAWQDYWFRTVPSAVRVPPPRSDLDEHEDPQVGTAMLDSWCSPPDIFDYLEHSLTRATKAFPSLTDLGHASEFGQPQPCRTTMILTEIYRRMSTASRPERSHDQSLAERAGNAVSFIVSEGLGHEWLAKIVPGVAVPIWEMMRLCQSSPRKDWPAEMYHLIGRADLALQVLGGHTPPERMPLTKTESGVPSIADLMAGYGMLSEGTSALSLPHVRFGSDRRLEEAERIMQTSKPRTIQPAEPKGISDAELAQFYQTVVNILANRTMAVLVGQAIFRYGTQAGIVTAATEIPAIELSAKILPGKLVQKAQYVQETTDWPCFHNGAAAGLSISPDAGGIDSSWILLNRPQTLNPEHGGLLLGLGLNGHLRSLLHYHSLPYFNPRHEFTSIGLLLGLAASLAGSEDAKITKILSLHTRAFLPLGSMDLSPTPLTQCAALMGLGLVHAGSRSLRSADTALSEVGRKDIPGSEGSGDYAEAYSFSASMAFGLIMLGRGGPATSEIDRRLLMKLQRCMSGNAAQDATLRPNAQIDTTLSGPGAILALGLMYLKSGRRDIADMLEIPKTAFDAENVRPDLLLMRTFARGLILWDDIAPSDDWLHDQLPAYIKDEVRKKRSNVDLSVDLAYMYIVAGACLAMGLKYAGTATEMAHSNLMIHFAILSKACTLGAMTFEVKIKRNAARQCLNVVTLALAVVMSGTGELNVLKRLRISHGQEGAGVNYGTHMAMHMALGILFLGHGHYTLGNSNIAIACMAIAFFPRFLPNASDNKAYPQAFRHLWAMAAEPRCLVARDVDSNETVYLPIKVRVKDGDRIRQQSLISPTLVAPFGSLLSVEVDSPRYWPISYDLSVSRDRDHLVRTRTIFVKRKTGFLEYLADPKGNRSMFVRVGGMTGFDVRYDLISPASPPTIGPNECLDLITVHSGDPGLIAFASHFLSDTLFDRLVRLVLVECVSLDKPQMIGPYLDLFLAKDAVQLAFARAFYLHFMDSAASPANGGRTNEFPLVRASFLSALSRQLSAPEIDANPYFIDGTWSENGHHLARYLHTNNVPPLDVLRDFKRQIQAFKVTPHLLGNARATAEIWLRDSAMAYRSAVLAAYEADQPSQQSTRGGEAREWKFRSTQDALIAWGL